MLEEEIKQETRGDNFRQLIKKFKNTNGRDSILFKPPAGGRPTLLHIIKNSEDKISMKWMTRVGELID